MNLNNDTFVFNSTDEILKQKVIDAIENNAGISVKNVDVKIKDNKLDISYEMKLFKPIDFLEFSVVLAPSKFDIGEYLLKNGKE